MLNTARKDHATSGGAGGRWAAQPPFVCLCLPYLLLLVTCYSVFVVTTDDPFITYRYAKNLLDGHGPVYNIGDHVEGFSSPLHLLACAALLKVWPGAGILFKAKLAGILFALVALFQTGRLGRLSNLRPWERLLAQMLVALNINFALAAVNGLETTLAVCILLWVLRVFLEECLGGRGGLWSAVLLGLALLTRPEMGMVFPGLLIVRLLWTRRRHLPVRGGLAWALLFVGFAALLTLARLMYYREPLPNTYYAKHVLIARGLSEGVLYLLHPLSPLVLTVSSFWRLGGAWSDRLAVLGAGFFWVLAALGGWARLGRLEGWTSGAAVAALIVFVLRAGGDWMAGWRFLAPALPVFAILQCHGLRAVFYRCRFPRRLHRLTAFALVVGWGVCAWVSPHSSWGAARYVRDDRSLLAANGPLGRKWVATAEFIFRNPSPGQRIAYSEMGYAGWRNRQTTFYDVRGLTDWEIARLSDREKGSFGVDDEDWSVPGDPLFRILTKRHPSMIIAFSHERVPTVVLGHYFLAARVRDPRDSAAVISPSLVYVRHIQTLKSR